ncbi:hypothetical protein OTU49_008449 [Cherax quadricarinatus]|uniref:CENP-T/Histone H4 histone fold domain-containing protein n=2 Tax=Cherax quadricarinatus TaxID=27406 RepID=A0AAW0WGK3_CHEQU|nr:microtubule-associated protein futsch-like isoform X1 [Cherax quadricarinatus]XP_053654989.1 microtubule-associated protein futsch-like isoform X1 [Cherax quadricarinatus]XP_053654990.1 microtubule-associated protein futsch-like isoform X1 [Cherax quadricarinatus]
MMEDVYMEIENSTPRTTLQQLLEVHDPEETPDVLKNQPLRTPSSAKKRKREARKSSAAKQIKGKDVTNLQTNVLSQSRQSISTSVLGESLNASSIRGVDQTYANLNILESSESSINEDLDLERAARFHKRRQHPLKNLSQPRVSVAKLKKPKTSKPITRQDLEKSPGDHGSVLNTAENKVNIENRTYAGVNTSMMESSSDSIDYEAVKKMRSRTRREVTVSHQGLKTTSVSHSLPPSKAPDDVNLENDITYAGISSNIMESSVDSIDYGIAKNVRYRKKKQDIVLDEFGPVPSGQNLPLGSDLTYTESVTSVYSPEDIQSGTNRDTVKELRSLKTNKTASPQKLDLSLDSRSTTFSEGSVSKLDQIYEVSNEGDESLENVRKTTRQRFARKAPDLKLNVTALVEKFKLNQRSALNAEEAPEQIEADLKAPSSPTENEFLDEEKSDWQASQEISLPKNEVTSKFLPSEVEASTIPQVEGVKSSSHGRTSNDNTTGLQSKEVVLPPVGFRDERNKFHKTSLGDFSSDSEDDELVSNINATLIALANENEEISVGNNQYKLQLSPLNSPLVNHGVSAPSSPTHGQDSPRNRARDRSTFKGSPRKSQQKSATPSPLESPQKSVEANVAVSQRKSPRKSVGDSSALLSKSPKLSVRDDGLSAARQSPRKGLVRRVLSPARESPRKSIRRSAVSPAKESPRKSIRRATMSPAKESPRKSIRRSIVSPAKESPRKSVGRGAVSPAKESPRKSIRRATMSPAKESPRKSIRIATMSSLKESSRKSVGGGAVSPSKESPRKSIGRASIEIPRKSVGSGTMSPKESPRESVERIAQSPTEDRTRSVHRSSISPSKDIPQSVQRTASLSPTSDSPRSALNSPKNVSSSYSPSDLEERDITRSVRNSLPFIPEKKSSMKNIVLTQEQFEVHPEEAFKLKHRISGNLDGSANALLDKDDMRSSIIPKDKAIVMQEQLVLRDEDIPTDIMMTKVRENVATYSSNVTAKSNEHVPVREELLVEDNSHAREVSANKGKDNTGMQRNISSKHIVQYDDSSSEGEVIYRFTQDNARIKEKESLPEDISTSEDSGSDDLNLLPVTERKIVRLQQGSPVDADKKRSEAEVTAYHLNVEEQVEDEGSDSNSSNQELGAGTSQQHRNNSRSGIQSKSLVSSKGRQMTMKEFIQNLAVKPMPPPAVADMEKERSTLAGLLKFNTSRVQKLPQQTAAAKKIRKKSKQSLPASLPKSVTKEIFSHFAKCKVTEGAMKAIMKTSEEYWKNLSTDLSNIVNARKGGDEILGRDVRKLMTRQGLITTEESLFALAEKYLPAEEWNTIIPTEYAKGNVHPPEKVIQDMFM